MGAAITENTTLGRRALPIRKRLARTVRRVELHPPEGVAIGHHGGHNHLSPHGYVGLRLWQFSKEREGYTWLKPGGAVTFVRRILEGSSGSHNALDLLLAFLPVIDAELRQAQAVVISEDDEDTREVEERRHLALVPPAPPMIHPATGDPEIDAIAAIKNILDPLNDQQVKRVVSYVMSRRELQDA